MIEKRTKIIKKIIKIINKLFKIINKIIKIIKKIIKIITKIITNMKAEIGQFYIAAIWFSFRQLPIIPRRISTTASLIK